MIGGNIDGSAGGQLFDLLKVVANPDVYQEKLKALESATAENKKFVELVGKADEIMKLREAAKKDLDDAKAKLESAKQEAAKIVEKAKSDAQSMLDSAASKAERDLMAVADRVSEIDQKLGQAKAASASANTDRASAEAMLKDVAAKQAHLERELEVTKKAKESYEKLKAEIIAKHSDFIESL